MTNSNRLAEPLPNVRISRWLLAAIFGILAACTGKDEETLHDRRPSASLHLEASHIQDAMIAELSRRGVKVQTGINGDIYYDPTFADEVRAALAVVIERATPACFVIAENREDIVQISADLKTARIDSIVTPGIAPNSWYVSWDSNRCDEGQETLRQAELMRLEKFFAKDAKGVPQ